jgi:hypothetical protein
VEPPGQSLAAEIDENDSLDLKFADSSVTDAPAHAAIPEPGLGLAEGRFEIARAGTDAFQFQGEMPVAATALAVHPGDIVECVNRLVKERDEAWEQCARLAREVGSVRDQLAERLAEVARLRKSADRLKAVRAERNQLNAERAMLAREATQLQSRMVETQVTLVEVGAELDECRERLSTERQEWHQQRQQLIAEAECRLAALRSQIASECRTTEQPQHDELDPLGATLDDAELQQCVPISGG